MLLCFMYQKWVVFYSMIFYQVVAEPTFKLRSLSVSDGKNECNQENQINSFWLILITFENWISKSDYSTAFTGEVFPLQEIVKTSWVFRWLLKNQRRVNGSVSLALAWSHLVCSSVWSRNLPCVVSGNSSEGQKTWVLDMSFL